MICNGTASHPGKILVFSLQGNRPLGQGVGNVMRGVFAALTLGKEYRRRVCIKWLPFEMAFRATDSVCRNLPRQCIPHPIHAWNFQNDSRVAELRKALGGPNRVVVFASNRVFGEFSEETLLAHGTLANHTVGRQWDTFEQEYTPSLELQRLRKNMTRSRCAVVAHLRMGDATEQHNRDLFRLPHSEVWPFLRRCLPRAACILSDQAETYVQLANFWQPPWGALKHTALSSRTSRILWLRVFSEWSLLREAELVLSTWSGFSQSAVLLSKAMVQPITAWPFDESDYSDQLKRALDTSNCHRIQILSQVYIHGSQHQRGATQHTLI